MAKSNRHARGRTVANTKTTAAIPSSVVVLAGLRDVLTQVANGDPDGAIDTLEDMLDEENFETTLDGTEELALLATLASDDDFDDEEFEEEADADEDDEDDEDFEDEEDEEDFEESASVQTSVKAKYLNKAFASLDDLEDAEDDEDEEEQDDEEDDEEEATVTANLRKNRRQKAVASAAKNPGKKRLL